MKLAIVHDHLIQLGGAEQVLAKLHAIWPEAPIYTLLYDQRQFGDIFNISVIHTSFLQRLPGALKRYQWYLPLMPTATESYDLSGYDVVISSSSAFAKSVLTHSHTCHICYCHTPTRYLWSDTHRYVEELLYPKIIKKFLPFMLSRLRAYDQLSAQRVDYFIANSQFVSKRIYKYYRRTSDVIHPPVETRKFSISPSVEKYFVTGGRLVPYKRFDIVVKAFNQLGIPLKIFGTGPAMRNLTSMAKPNIEFLGKISFQDLATLYSRAVAFINPQVEDFGITAVEAMASGRPVIAYDGGGARETVLSGVSGEFFDEQSWEALADKIVRFKPEQYHPLTVKTHAEKFSAERFHKEMFACVEAKVREYREKPYADRH